MLVGLLRFLGGFPYVRSEEEPPKSGAWSTTEGGSREASGGRQRELRGYKRSRVWGLWSRFVCLMMVVYSANFAWEVLVGISLRELDTPTVKTANMFENCVTFATVISVTLYVNFNKALALDLVSQLQALRRRGTGFATNTRRNVLMSLMLLVFLACHIAILGLCVPFMAPHLSHTDVKEMFEVVLELLTNGFSMCFYLAAVAALREAYDDLHARLSQLRPPRGPAFVRVAGRDETFTDAGELGPGAPAKGQDLLQDASDSLLRLHDLQRLLHRYLEFPITMVMLQSIISTILCLFYLSYWAELPVSLRLVNGSYAVISVVPSLVLCNIPEMLQNRVSKGRRNPRQELQYWR